MNEQIKLEETEINEIRTLQDNFQKKLFQLGQIRLGRLKLEKSLDETNNNERILMTDWSNLEKTETELVDKLLKKYGEGALDLTSGTFTPEAKR